MHLQKEIHLFLPKPGADIEALAAAGKYRGTRNVVVISPGFPAIGEV